MIPKAWWFGGLIGLVIVAILPCAGHLMRGGDNERCAWDGLEIEPIYQVRIVEESGFTGRFCCLRCAEAWQARRGQPLNVFVTDEASGMELDAAQAVYVRSTVITNAITGNRRHVFRRIEDATKHAEAAHGHRLLGAERPFAKMDANEPETPDG
jgi:hypothetical protein